MAFIVDNNKTAIKYDDRVVSYKELIVQTKAVASHLEIEKEERVIVFIENKPEFFYGFLAVWDKKGTAVCLDETFTAKDLEYYISDADSKWMITSQKNEATAREAIEKLGLDIKVLVIEELSENDYSGEMTLEHPDRDSVAVMLYTSGTTGDPKGVMLTYDNILVNVEGLEHHKIYHEDDVVLAILPMHHIFPLFGAGVIPLSKGSTVVFLKELSKAAIGECLQKHGITMIIAVPRLYEMFHKGIMDKINSNKVAKILFNMCEKLQNIKLSRKLFKKVHEGFGGKIKYFVAGGAKVDAQMTKDFLTLGIEVLEGYGMTETAPMMAFTPGGHVIPGSAGYILPGTELKIADDGEILAKGRHVMKGYFNKPEATAETVIDGWMHTGDLGEIRGENVYITGRKKEMIVLSNGKNINPVEIEVFLSRNSLLIQEIAVTEYNNVLTAVVYPNFQEVKNQGITNIKETLKWGVIDKYNVEAQSYKKVLAIEVVGEELPKTKIGKIRRFMLKEFLDNLDKEVIKEDEPTYEEYVALSKYLKNVKGRDISPSAHLELDLGLDSLELVELLAHLEASFGVEANEELIVNYPTVKSLAEYLKEHSEGIVDGDINWNEILSKDIKVNFPSSNKYGFVLKKLMKPFFGMYLKVDKEGVVKEGSKPVIFAGNHQSYLDGAILNSVLPKGVMSDTYYMAKVKHFESNNMKNIADNMNILVVDINKNLAETLQTLALALKSGKNIVIFPEGIRSRDGHMSDFKKSFAILSKELDVSVVPFGIKGAYEALPTGKKIPSSGRVSIKFFDPIEPKDLAYNEIVEKTSSTISKWLG